MAKQNNPAAVAPGRAAPGAGVRALNVSLTPQQRSARARRAALRRWAKKKRRKEQAPRMAISPRMLALIQKIEAADAEHLASLRESARRDAEAKVRAKKRAATRAAEARSVVKKRKAS
jgi:hypothetical protein